MENNTPTSGTPTTGTPTTGTPTTGTPTTGTPTTGTPISGAAPSNATIKAGTPITFESQSTGSPALDRLLERSYLRPGQMLRLCGGEPHLQRQLLLGFCNAASARGARSVYLDLDGTLGERDIEAAGLLDAFNAADPADPGALFRVLVPQGFVDARTQLETLARGKAAPIPQVVVPSVVVLEGLQSATFRSLSALPDTQQGWWSLAATLALAMSGYNVARGLGKFTLWIAHSPKVHRPRLGPPTAFGGPFATMVRTEVKKECGGALDIGQVEPLPMDCLRVAVKALDYRSRVAGEGDFELWRDGQFKND